MGYKKDIGCVFAVFELLPPPLSPSLLPLSLSVYSSPLLPLLYKGKIETVMCPMLAKKKKKVLSSSKSILEEFHEGNLWLGVHPGAVT